MLLEGTRLLGHDRYLGGLTARTLQLAFEATAIAVVLGLPAACAIGVGRSRRSGWGLALANAGLGLPPVAVGVYLFLALLGRSAPWGGYWINTMNGMVVGQTILALPIVIAIAAIAIRGLPDGLVDQAHAFGASGWRLGLFTLREAKIGVITAVIFALGSAFAEVGAVTIIGGNSVSTTATLASQVINDAHESDVPAAVEHSLVLMGLVVALGVILTVVQNWRPGALRRRLPGVRTVAGTAVFVTLVAALAACGKTIHVHDNRIAYAIDANGTSPPITDLARLIAERSHATGMAPTLTAAAGLSLPGDVRRQTRLGTFDPRLNRTPAVSDLVVVGVLDPAAIEPLAATALKRGVKVVSYPVALRRRTAAVIADPSIAATLLATHAAAWAGAHNAQRGRALLVLPPADQTGVNPFASRGTAIERAWRAALARDAPGLTVSTVTGAHPAGGRLAVEHALAAHPGLRVVLVWDDDTAIGAAQALRAGRPRGERARLYVGALGAPAVTSQATFAELDRRDVLRAVVATRVRDLADALVDLPRALLRGGTPHDVKLAPVILTPHSPALAAYRRDYAAHPPGTAFSDTPLNPTALNEAP